MKKIIVEFEYIPALLDALTYGDRTIDIANRDKKITISVPLPKKVTVQEVSRGKL